MTQTVKQLKATAKTLKIEGYTKLNKEQLIAAIEAVSQPADNAERVKMIKRKQSANARDENGLVIRAGKNLSGNTPWKYKFYALGEVDRVALEAAPNQVRLIVRAMEENGVDLESDGMTGKQIVDMAKETGVLKSKIPSANLFAYYRRVLEACGVVHVA